MTMRAATATIRPVILVHAITAAGLHDEYPLDHERVWSPLELALKDTDRVTLYPDARAGAEETRYEAREPALVRPSELFGLLYKDLAAALRHELTSAATPIVPVYPFAYDWRQDLRLTMRKFEAFVGEVIARTRHLRRKADVPPCDCVDVVGHSMGGLVIAGALSEGLLGEGEACRVRRVVSLGTPFLGAVASVAKIAAGAGPLFGRAGREREREMARTTPSVYQLLPAYEGALVREDGGAMVRDAIFREEHFQDTVIRGLGDYFAAHVADESLAMHEQPRVVEGALLLRRMLACGREMHEIVARLRPDDVLRPDGGWLAIVGVAEKTLVRTRVVEDDAGLRWFDFSKSLMNAWDDADDGADRFDTGDGTVPLRGALPPWDREGRRVVIVRQEDFGWPFEAFDSAFASAQGLHAALPLMNLAQRWTISMLRGARQGLLRTRRAPGVESLAEFVRAFGPRIEGLDAAKMDAGAR